MRPIGFVLKIVVFLLVVVLGFGQAVLHLWNWLMPVLFHLPLITFWQAVGLLGLSWLLFGGWRGFRGPGGHRGGPWRRRMAERWESMTPEEREKFKQGMRRGCGPFSREAPAKG
jgi:Ca2+/H+ antiporter, TMEM165/GDT1 family